MSFRSPEGEETLRPPWSDLGSPGIISKHGRKKLEVSLQIETQPEFERERDMGRPVF